MLGWKELWKTVLEKSQWPLPERLASPAADEHILGRSK